MKKSENFRPNLWKKILYLILTTISLSTILQVKAAETTLSEGTIGWSYYNGSQPGYVADATQACRLTATNHMGTPLIDMRISPGIPDGTKFDCKYSHFLVVGGLQWFGSTTLYCKYGYRAMSPGICVANAQPLTAATCTPGRGGYIKGNPVTVASGGKFQTEIDLLSGQFNALKITRTYRTFRNSGKGQSGGVEWSFSFDRVFEATLADARRIYTIEGATGDGSYFKFRWDPSKEKYISVFDKSATLEQFGPMQEDFLLVLDGKIEHYRKMPLDGRYTFVLLSSQGFEGAKEIFSYDPFTLRLHEITDSQGRRITLKWNGDGSLATASSAERTIAYHYDHPNEYFPSIVAGGRLISVEYMDSVGLLLGSKKYHYEDPAGRAHLLTGITDENGAQYASYAYDADGRTILSEHADGAERYTFAYPDANNRLITDPLGTVRKFGITYVGQIALTAGISQPGGSGCNAATNSIVHDLDGNIEAQTDFSGNKICHLYDKIRGLEISQTSGLSSGISCPKNVDEGLKPGARRIRTDWHDNFPLRTAVSQPGLITRYYYNGDLDKTGQIVRCALDMSMANGKPFPVLCKKTEYATADIDGARGLTALTVGGTREWNYQYDELGRLLKTGAPKNEAGQEEFITQTYYADTSGTHLAGDLATMANAMGETTYYLEYSPDGMATQIKQPDGLTLSLKYDGRKRLLAAKLQDPEGTTETTGYDYDSVGNLVRVTQPDQSAVILSYDAAHRLTQMEDTAGNSVRLTLDGAGNVIRQEVRGPNQEIFAQISRSYDSLNRLQRQKNGPNDTGIAYQYDANGNMTSIVDQLGRIINRQYDNFNRLVRVQTPAPQLNAPRGLTSFGYNNRDLLTSVTDPRLLTTNYAVDSFGQRLGTNSPDTGISFSAFDESGDIKTSTDARNITTNYRWDAAGRIRQIGNKVFEYVQPGSVGAGRLSLLRDESGQTSFAYDGFGRIQTKTQVVNLSALSRTLEVSYTYGSSGNATGHPISITYPSGARLEFQYNTEGRVKNMSIRHPGSDIIVPLVNDIQYSPIGELAGWSWGNSNSASPNIYARTFDTQGRLLSYPLGNLQTGGILRTLQYDSVGRIIASGHDGNANAKLLDQQYEYDDLDRVISFRSHGVMQNYNYDSNGNRVRTSFGVASYSNTISLTSNRMVSTTGPAPAKTNIFDSSGNLVSDGVTNFTYGVNGRMETSTTSGLTTTYQYNGRGERVAKSTSSDTNFYVYNEEGSLLGEYDSAGRLIQETFYLGRVPIAVVASPSGTTTFPLIYVFADHLGSPRVLARADDNKILWRWDQADPFGLYLPDEDPSGLGKFVYNLRFPGQYYDKQTNLHYNYFRDYDPVTGRYIQSDPIGLDGGNNTYAYVGGNPVNLIDPFGLIDIYVGGAKDGTTKIVRSWVDKNATGSPYFEWSQFQELLNYISKVPANEPINLYGHSYGGDTAAWAAMHVPCRINSLTTLDPVSRMKPNFKRLARSVGTWHNVNAIPPRLDWTDVVAWAGGKWGALPEGIASSFSNANVNHGDFGGIMKAIKPSTFGACGCPIE